MIRNMNGRILIVTMHNKYRERQVYIMPETFAVEVETNGTEIYVSFKRFVDDKEKNSLDGGNDGRLRYRCSHSGSLM